MAKSGSLVNILELKICPTKSYHAKKRLGLRAGGNSVNDQKRKTRTITCLLDIVFF
jgi:hypothetical protein